MAISRGKLTAYLKTVSDLEAAIHTNKEAKKKLEGERKFLGIPAKIEMEEVNRREVNYVKPGGKWVVLIGTILGVIYLIMFVKGYIFYTVNNDLFGAYQDFIKKSLIDQFVPSIVVFFAIALCAKVIPTHNAKTEYNRSKAKADSDYERTLAKAKMVYDEALKTDKARLQKENELADDMKMKIAEIDSNISKLQAELDRLYAMNIIYDSYRGQVATAYMYDYVASGMCPGLEGSDGAYAQYVNDIRAQRIVASIEDMRDVMKQGFAAVLSMQNTMCNQLSSCMQILGSMDRSMASINNNVGVIRGNSYKGLEYQQQCAEQAARIADGVDRVALNSSIAELNRMNERAQSGVNTFGMNYPD